MKKKLAIISTYDDLCGIASYTRSICKQLEQHYEITVFDLNQMVFRSKNKLLKEMASEEVNRICAALRTFDCVNIQLEHGTIASTPELIIERLNRFIDASPALCVTYHTVIQTNESFFDLLPLLKKAKFLDAYTESRRIKSSALLSNGLNKILFKAQKIKKVSFLLHSRKDARTFELLYGFNNVFHHPLSYIKDSDALKIRNDTTIEKDFPLLKAASESGLPILLGAFGFFGRYKGLETTIKALELLPENYHLAVFGGLHPNAIVKNSEVDPYISSLLEKIVPPKMIDEKRCLVLSKTNSATPEVVMSEQKQFLMQQAPGDLSKRIHFVGSLTDDEFPKAMAVCNIVILPYLEVGQSASGPMSMAVDMKANIIASRTKTFMQYARYHKNRFKMFDVGNFLQLAQLIKSYDNRPLQDDSISEYTVDTNIEVYKKALFWDVVND